MSNVFGRLLIGGVLSMEAGAASAGAPALLDSYNVCWDTPGENVGGSVPLGNGDIALNAWADKSGDLLFYIGKSDAWSGDLTSPGYGGRSLIKVGLIRVSLSPNPFDGASGFRQELRLREGVLEIGTKDKFPLMRLWVDACRPVIHVESTTPMPVQMRVNQESWRKVPANGLGADTIVTGQTNRVVWYYKSSETNIPALLHRTIGAAITGLKSASAPTTNQHVMVHVLTAQCPTQDQWLERLDRQIAATEAVSLEQSRREHLGWWEGFWDRSHIFVTAGANAREVTTGYLLQRFKNACTGRGEFPIKFNGSLFVLSDFRAWGHQYWFQNTRAIYWPMLASGDYDLMQPLFKMYRDMLPGNTKQVREFYQHDGAYFAEIGPFWGGLGRRTPESEGGYGNFYYTPILEYSAMALDCYAHTGDAAFLKNIVLPMADAGVTFFDQHFKRDAQGRLLIEPADAIEMYFKVRNPLPDVAGLRYVLQRLIDLPPELTGPSARARWQRLLTEVPPVLQNGKILPMDAGGPQPKASNVENPELYAIYPFRLYGVGKPGIEVAQAAFQARGVRKAGCWYQDAVQAALLGYSAEAQTNVTVHFTRYGARFPAFWSKGNDEMPDEDNGGNGMHALQSMLLQAEGDKVLVLPAWPRDWDVDFKLHAPRQTIIEGSVRAGSLTSLKVTPESRRKDVVVMVPK